jgi:hypothetical protein
MPDWLDSWTNTKRLNQQELAKRWATRNDPVIEEPKVVQSPVKARPLPLAHTLKILQFGTKAYRKWESEGFSEDYIWERIP